MRQTMPATPADRTVPGDGVRLHVLGPLASQQPAAARPASLALVDGGFRGSRSR